MASCRSSCSCQPKPMSEGLRGGAKSQSSLLTGSLIQRTECHGTLIHGLCEHRHEVLTEGNSSSKGDLGRGASSVSVPAEVRSRVRAIRRHQHWHRKSAVGSIDAHSRDLEKKRVVWMSRLPAVPPDGPPIAALPSTISFRGCSELRVGCGLSVSAVRTA